MRSVPFGVLLLAEMPRMQPRGLSGVVAAVQVVAVGEIRLTGRLVVLPRPVVTCRRAVMLSGMLEMFGGFSVMVDGFGRHVMAPGVLRNPLHSTPLFAGSMCSIAHRAGLV